MRLRSIRTLRLTILAVVQTVAVSPKIGAIILFLKLKKRMPQCSEFEATCFRYASKIFGRPTIGLYERNRGKTPCRFMVLSVMVMSALFDVLTSMLLISCLLLGYSALSTFQRIVVSSFSVSLFELPLVGLLECEDEGTTSHRNADRCICSVFRHTQHLILTR